MSLFNRSVYLSTKSFFAYNWAVVLQFRDAVEPLISSYQLQGNTVVIEADSVSNTNTTNTTNTRLNHWTRMGFAFRTALILGLVRIDTIASRSRCRFVSCASVMQISRSTTSQRCSAGLRSGDCGGHLSSVNSLSCSRNQFEMIWALWRGTFSCWKQPLEDVYAVVIKGLGQQQHSGQLWL